MPGGPCSSTPLTWRMPRRSTTDGGNTRDANARRKIASNCASRPPMPSRSKLTSLCLNSCGVAPPRCPLMEMPAPADASHASHMQCKCARAGSWPWSVHLGP